MENTAYLFQEETNQCPFKMVRGINVRHDNERVVIDEELSLLFNLTTPRRINVQGCPFFTMYGTTLDEIYLSLDPQARMLERVDARNLREDQDLLPTLAYMSHHHAEQINKLRRSQQEGSCQMWLSISNDRDYHHPVRREAGLFVRRTGRVIYEYECNQVLVTIAELKHCTRATPVILRGKVVYADLDTRVVSPHEEIVPCHHNYPMMLETSKKIWVSVSKQVLQVKPPSKLEDKFEETKEDSITQLYTTEELANWEDFKNFPVYMKSAHQKMMNSFCAADSCTMEAQSLSGKIYDLNGLIQSSENKGAELLENLNPWGVVTKEMTIIKDFVMLCLIVEYIALGISCATAVVLFGVTATLAALINRVTLDWSKLKKRNKPRVEAVRMGRLLQNEEADC
mgnify:FL=1